MCIEIYKDFCATGQSVLVINLGKPPFIIQEVVVTIAILLAL